MRVVAVFFFNGTATTVSYALSIRVFHVFYVCVIYVCIIIAKEGMGEYCNPGECSRLLNPTGVMCVVCVCCRRVICVCYICVYYSYGVYG